MKNSKFLKPAIALSLVGAMVVGGTLAYITSSTVEVNNEFVFAYSSGEGYEDEDDILSISLTEVFKDADGETVAANEDGVYSTTFMPGDEFSKTATVSLDTLELEDGAYVFLKVDGDTDSNVTYAVDTSTWTKVTGYEDLYMLATVQTTTGSWTVLKDNEVTISADADFTDLLDLEIDIDISAYAIQAANVDSATAIAQAATALNATATAAD